MLLLTGSPLPSTRDRDDGDIGILHFPIINHPQSMIDLLAESDLSKIISVDLKKRGMSFVGSTIIYAFMQAVGMVDDHIESCFCKEKSL